MCLLEVIDCLGNMKLNCSNEPDELFYLFEAKFWSITDTKTKFPYSKQGDKDGCERERAREGEKQNLMKSDLKGFEAYKWRKILILYQIIEIQKVI